MTTGHDELAMQILRTPARERERVKQALAACGADDVPFLHWCYARATGDRRRAAVAKRIGELTRSGGSSATAPGDGGSREKRP